MLYFLFFTENGRVLASAGGKKMTHKHDLGFFLEDLWAQGFRLSDDNIHFIYLGKKMTKAPDWKVILALKATIQVQKQFVGSFYLSLLELLADSSIKNEKDAANCLEQTGLEIVG